MSENIFNSYNRGTISFSWVGLLFRFSVSVSTLVNFQITLCNGDIVNHSSVHSAF